MPEITLTTLVVLCLAAAAAGWIDAVVGGGGLLLLPALLLGLPHVPAAHVLGTNKAVAIVGTSGAAVTYLRKAPVRVGTAVRIGLMALAGSMTGAFFAAGISSDVLRPVIMVVLLAVAAFVMLRPSFGTAAAGDGAGEKVTRARTVTAIVLVGGGIGFYDGLFGPGTGTFLVLALTAVLHLDLVTASANAKIVNVCTNMRRAGDVRLPGDRPVAAGRADGGIQSRGRDARGADGSPEGQRLRPRGAAGRGVLAGRQARLRPVERLTGACPVRPVAGPVSAPR